MFIKAPQTLQFADIGSFIWRLEGSTLNIFCLLANVRWCLCFRSYLLLGVSLACLLYFGWRHAETRWVERVIFRQIASPSFFLFLIEGFIDRILLSLQDFFRLNGIGFLKVSEDHLAKYLLFSLLFGTNSQLGPSLEP